GLRVRVVSEGAEEVSGGQRPLAGQVPGLGRGQGGRWGRLVLGPTGRAVAGQELAYLGSGRLDTGAERGEGMGADSGALAEYPEQDVFGADVVVAEREGFA